MGSGGKKGAGLTEVAADDGSVEGRVEISVSGGHIPPEFDQSTHGLTLPVSCSEVQGAGPSYRLVEERLAILRLRRRHDWLRVYFCSDRNERSYGLFVA
jgi:hypothetical protein